MRPLLSTSFLTVLICLSSGDAREGHASQQCVGLKCASIGVGLLQKSPLKSTFTTGKGLQSEDFVDVERHKEAFKLLTAFASKASCSESEQPRDVAIALLGTHLATFPVDFCGPSDHSEPTHKYKRLEDAVALLAGSLDLRTKKDTTHVDALTSALALLHNVAEGGERFLCLNANDHLIQHHLGSFLPMVQRQINGIEALERGVGALTYSANGYPLQASVWNALEGLKLALDKNNGLAYVENLFPVELHERLLKERDRLWKGGAALIEPSCSLDGSDRIGGFLRPSAYIPTATSETCVPRLEHLYEAVYANPELQRFLSQLTGSTLYPSDLPLELRRYGEDSSGMPWHQDVVLFQEASTDYEVIYTLDNHGHSRTDFVDKSGKTNKQLSKANSLFIVRSAAVRHMVTPSGGGKRDIIKAVYTATMQKTKEFWTWGSNDCTASHPNFVAAWTRGI